MIESFDRLLVCDVADVALSILQNEIQNNMHTKGMYRLDDARQLYVHALFCLLQEQRLLSASRLYTTSVIVFIATIVCAVTICLTDRPPKPKQEGTVD